MPDNFLTSMVKPIKILRINDVRKIKQQGLKIPIALVFGTHYSKIQQKYKNRK